jgi:crotonobetainyl-CoA:carnitine CoA-transferase CaiB-like acyl-CoA transferase
VAHETAPVVHPPFLPVAGIAFGQQVATQMLAQLLKVKDTNSLTKSICYLHDTAELIFSPFWPKKQRTDKRVSFLHNGAYPCYSLYRLKDGNYLAVAAVEEKFWTDLIETFAISWPLERRFETGAEGFSVMAQTFAKLTSNEIEIKASNKELCISIVRKEN